MQWYNATFILCLSVRRARDRNIVSDIWNHEKVTKIYINCLFITYTARYAAVTCSYKIISIKDWYFSHYVAFSDIISEQPNENNGGKLVKTISALEIDFYFCSSYSNISNYKPIFSFKTDYIYVSWYLKGIDCRPQIKRIIHDLA